MIKKYFLYASIASLALSLGACSDQLDNPVVGGNDGTVIFTAQLPEGLASRADVSFNQGEKATNLSYAVYKSGAETPEVIFASGDGAAPEASYDADTKSFTLSLNLVKGQTYDFVFWADADNSPYTFKAADQSVTIDYTNVAGNDDARDAFFTSITGLTVSGAMQKNVELRRPFAQLNIGTDDVEVAKAAKIEHATTTVTVSDVYSTLNLLSGLAADPVEVVFPAHAASELAFPVVDENKTYTYLSMNYILTGSVIMDGEVNKAQKETKDLTISFADNNEKQINEFKLSAVPFQRNYRTNVYGSLLTSKIDLNIEVVPGFAEEPGHNYEVIDVWDGVSIDVPTEYKDLYEIKTAAELVGLAQYATANPGQVYNVVLQSTIDLGGNKFEGFNPRRADNSEYALTASPFIVNFDGQGNSIRNFVTRQENELQWRYAEGGLFGVLSGTVKDLVIEDATVGSIYNGDLKGNIAGVLAGYVRGNGKIENVTVRNCTVYGFAKVGGLVGYDYAQGSEYTNCTVENTKIYGVYNTAYMIGFVSNDNITINGQKLVGNSFEPAPNNDYQLVVVEPTVAFDGNKGQRPARLVGGKFVPIGSTYYATEAVYYNRFDVIGTIGYRIIYNGENVEIDGYQVNELGVSNIVEDLPIDVQPVTYANVAYDGIYKSTENGEYYIASAAGLASLNALVTKLPGSMLYGRTFNLTADIDATGVTWTTKWMTNDSASMKGFTLNGNGHTITGLTIFSNSGTGCGLFTGPFRGNVSTGEGGTVIKDLTFRNVTATGTNHTAVLIGQLYGGCVTIENVHIYDSKATGTGTVGALVGTTVTNDGDDVRLTIKNCSVNGTSITAVGKEGSSNVSGASIFVGRAMNWAPQFTTLSFEGCTESGNTVNNAAGLYGGGWWLELNGTAASGEFDEPVVHNGAE